MRCGAIITESESRNLKKFWSSSVQLGIYSILLYLNNSMFDRKTLFTTKNTSHNVETCSAQFQSSSYGHVEQVSTLCDVFFVVRNVFLLNMLVFITES